MFQLDAKWTTVNEIRCNALVGPDVRNAINALELTASCWLHDSVEKAMIIQMYWPQYRVLYDTLVRCEAIVPGYDRACKSFIGAEVRKAYIAMEELSETGVPLTSTI